VQQQQQRNAVAKIQYCHWFQRFLREGVRVLRVEAHFK
jgi:hypothetical protein